MTSTVLYKHVTSVTCNMLLVNMLLVNMLQVSVLNSFARSLSLYPPELVLWYTNSFTMDRALIHNRPQFHPNSCF